MSTYGLGAGEAIRLKFEDIDWAAGTIKLVRAKTGVAFTLPMLSAVAEALALYLRDGRPRNTPTRHVFIQMMTPFGPLSCASPVRHILIKHAKVSGFECAVPWQPCAALLECGAAGRPRDTPASALRPTWSSRLRIDLRLCQDRHRVATRYLVTGADVTTVTADRLTRDTQEFLRFKRAMGIAYWRGEFVLNSFVRFVAQRWGDHGEVALDEAITRWCARAAGRKAVSLGNEFGVVRQLCLFRRRHDPTSYVPEHALAPIKESTFLPYIFSHEEVRRILALATSHHGRFIWAPMLRALILVLYCTGLRLGEAVRLRMADIDLDRGILKIPHSKGRARIVAIRTDLVAELRNYLAERQRLLRERRRPQSEACFLRLDASPLTVGSASNAICRLLRQLGLKPPSGRAGARPYEFRHAFAVHRLTAWANEGVDIHAKLPLLSAYLGHQNIIGTEAYLKATPQLLELASSWFEQHLRDACPPQ
jgi:integrase/recombinase XerD